MSLGKQQPWGNPKQSFRANKDVQHWVIKCTIWLLQTVQMVTGPSLAYRRLRLPEKFHRHSTYYRNRAQLLGCATTQGPCIYHSLVKALFTSVLEPPSQILSPPFFCSWRNRKNVIQNADVSTDQASTITVAVILAQHLANLVLKLNFLLKVLIHIYFVYWLTYHCYTF